MTMSLDIRRNLGHTLTAPCYDQTFSILIISVLEHRTVLNLYTKPYITYYTFGGMVEELHYINHYVLVRLLARL